MSIPVRRAVAWAGIVICTAVIVAVAAAIPLARPTSPLLTLLRIDVPAIAGILCFRFYLNRTGRRPS